MRCSQCITWCKGTVHMCPGHAPSHAFCHQSLTDSKLCPSLRASYGLRLRAAYWVIMLRGRCWQQRWPLSLPTRQGSHFKPCISLFCIVRIMHSVGEARGNALVLDCLGKRVFGCRWLSGGSECSSVRLSSQSRCTVRNIGGPWLGPPHSPRVRRQLRQEVLDVRLDMDFDDRTI
jgi:hypothetical protein